MMLGKVGVLKYIFNIIKYLAGLVTELTGDRLLELLFPVCQLSSDTVGVESGADVDEDARDARAAMC